MWEFDSERAAVDLVIRIASAKPVAFTIKVCSPQKPRLWSHPIMEVIPSTRARAWRLLPGIWGVDLTSKVGEPPKLVATPCGGRDARPFPCDLHAIIGHETHLILTDAPPTVDHELAELAL